MGFFKRLLGICRTRKPADPGCWSLADGKVEVDLAAAPELAPEGGAIRLEGGGLPRRVLVVHGREGGYHAFENRCAHAGRRLDPLPGKAQVQCCSVGRSTYGYDGSRISGMAKGPVRVLELEEEGGALVIRVT